MEYELKLGDKTVKLEIDATEDGGYIAQVDGVARNVSYTAIDENRMILRVEGEAALPIYLAPDQKGLWVWIRGKARYIQDAQAATSRKSRTGGADGPTEVTPQTPATVVSVSAAVGDLVTKGQALVVVSAMKMESTLTAPYAGTVTAVNTEPGAKVSPGDILVEIEPEPRDEPEGENE